MAIFPQVPWWLPLIVYDAVVVVAIAALRVTTGWWREAALWSACLVLPVLALLEVAAYLTAGPAPLSHNPGTGGGWLLILILTSPQNVIGLWLLLLFVLPELVVSPGRDRRRGVGTASWALLLAGTLWVNGFYLAAPVWAVG